MREMISVNNANAPANSSSRGTHFESFAFLTAFHILKPISFVRAWFESFDDSAASGFFPDLPSFKVSFFAWTGGGAGDVDCDCCCDSSASAPDSFRRFRGPSKIFAWSIPGSLFLPLAADTVDMAG